MNEGIYQMALKEFNQNRSAPPARSGLLASVQDAISQFMDINVEPVAAALQEEREFEEDLARARALEERQRQHERQIEIEREKALNKPLKEGERGPQFTSDGRRISEPTTTAFLTPGGAYTPDDIFEAVEALYDSDPNMEVIGVPEGTQTQMRIPRPGSGGVSNDFLSAFGGPSAPAPPPMEEDPFDYLDLAMLEDAGMTPPSPRYDNVGHLGQPSSGRSVRDYVPPMAMRDIDRIGGVMGAVAEEAVPLAGQIPGAIASGRDAITGMLGGLGEMYAPPAFMDDGMGDIVPPEVRMAARDQNAPPAAPNQMAAADPLADPFMDEMLFAPEDMMGMDSLVPTDDLLAMDDAILPEEFMGPEMGAASDLSSATPEGDFSEFLLEDIFPTDEGVARPLEQGDAAAEDFYNQYGGALPESGGFFQMDNPTPGSPIRSVDQSKYNQRLADIVENAGDDPNARALAAAGIDPDSMTVIQPTGNGFREVPVSTMRRSLSPAQAMALNRYEEQNRKLQQIETAKGPAQAERPRVQITEGPDGNKYLVNMETGAQQKLDLGPPRDARSEKMVDLTWGTGNKKNELSVPESIERIRSYLGAPAPDKVAKALNRPVNDLLDDATPPGGWFGRKGDLTQRGDTASLTALAYKASMEPGTLGEMKRIADSEGASSTGDRYKKAIADIEMLMRAFGLAPLDPEEEGEDGQPSGLGSLNSALQSDEAKESLNFILGR